MPPEVEPLLATEDEYVAIALLRGRSCAVPLRTVDLDDAADVRRSLGRGVRSMRLRGLIDGETSVTDEALLPLEQAVSGTMVALAAGVDAAHRLLITSPYVALLVGDAPNADAVLMRSDPDGTIAMAIATPSEGVDAMVASLEVETLEGEQLAVTLQPSAEGVREGLLRTHEGYFRMDLGLNGGAPTLVSEADLQVARDMIAAAVLS